MRPLRVSACVLLLVAFFHHAPAVADIGVATSGQISIMSGSCGCVSTNASATTSSTEGQYSDVTHNAHLTTQAVAAAGLLSLGTSASYSQGSDGDWNGIYWSSVANGSLQEPIAPDWETWNARYDQWNSTHVVFDFVIGVAGSVTASKGGPALPSAQASLSYFYTIADASGEGSKSDDVDAQTQSGAWEPIAGSFTLLPNQNTYDLLFQASASTMVSKFYMPFAAAQASATADFLHTLKWLGITGMHSYDANNQEIPLPPGAYIDLIGGATGFNYWHSVDAPVAVSPGESERPVQVGLACAPNPVRSGTTVQFRVPGDGTPVTLRAYDAAGRVARTLLAGARLRGAQAVRWDGRDDAGRALPRGVYALRLEGRGIAATTRVVFTR